MNVQSSLNSGSRTPTTLAEINVTPLVDVMLVLLIVFMISAPLMQQGLQVNLPKATAESLSDVPDQLDITVSRKKEILLNGKKIKSGTFLTKLRSIAEVKPDVQVFIRADSQVDYGMIARVIATVKQAKIHRVGLVTEPGERKKPL